MTNELEHLLDTLTLDALGSGFKTDFETEREIVFSRKYVYLRFCCGNVRIDAHFPLCSEHEMACVYRFKNGNAFHGLTQTQIEQIMLAEAGLPLEKRSFFIGYNKFEDDKPLLQLPGLRFTADLLTANNLIAAFDRVHDEYQKVKAW